MLVGRLVADSGKITTVAEARWLEVKGTDVIIAQGFDAGRHRGSFSGSPGSGMMAVPQTSTPCASKALPGYRGAGLHKSGIPQNSKQGLSGQAEFGLAFSLFRPE